MEYGSYLGYLQKFDHFHEISVNLKERYYSPYMEYLTELLDYLIEFFKKSQPLTDFGIVEKQSSKNPIFFIFLEEESEYKWKEGTIRGWERKPESEQTTFYCRPCCYNFQSENTFIVKKKYFSFFLFF